MLQRFPSEALDATRRAVAPIFSFDGAPHLTLTNWTGDEPQDARSILLNEGVRAAQGRYLAFLDYDDVLYPDAYELLVGRLTRTGAAIAFARVRIVQMDVHAHFLYPMSSPVPPPFNGNSLIDLFRCNFCPLHSYVIDRSQLSSDAVSFEPTLTLEEDYDLLLRICAQYPSDFALATLNVVVGEYCYKTDGSNFVPICASAPKPDHYENARLAIERRRQSTAVASEVQQVLGVADQRPRTVRQLIDYLPPVE